MSGRLRRIRDIAIGVYDGPHATPELHEEGAAVFLGIPNISADGRIDLTTARWVADRDLPRWNRRVTPQANDIVFTYEATLNRYAIIPEGMSFTLGRRTALIRPDPEEIDYRYLFYYFFAPRWRAQIEAKTMTGATVDRIPLTNFPGFEIYVPSLGEQRRIAAILSAYDDLIATNRRRIALLEESTRRLYREWFVHLRFPGHEAVKVVDGVPEGWRRGALGDFIKTSSGGTPSRKNSEYYGEGYRWVKTKELNNGFLFDTEEQITQAGLDNSSAKVFPAGTVLLAMYGATIGMSALLANAATTNQACCAFLVSEVRGLNYYCFIWLRDIRQKLISLGMGAAQPNLSQEVIRRLEFLLPPEDALEEFGCAAGACFEQIATLALANSQLAKARDALLPKLMSGQLDVSGIPLPQQEAA